MTFLKIIILSYPRASLPSRLISPLTFRNATPKQLLLNGGHVNLNVSSLHHLRRCKLLKRNDLANLAVMRRWSPRVEGLKILLARRSKNVSRLSIHKLQRVLVCLLRTKNNGSFGRYDHIQSGSGFAEPWDVFDR